MSEWPDPKLGRAALEVACALLCSCTEGPESGEGLDPTAHSVYCRFVTALEEYLSDADPAEPTSCEEAAKLARRCLSLDREPHPPTGGMQTGDMIVVGMRDWHQHQRLARMIARAAEEESDE